MKIRHGLQKKISCIFEGGRTPSVSQDTTDTSFKPTSDVQAGPAAGQTAASGSEMKHEAADPAGAEATVWDSLESGGSSNVFQTGGKISGRPAPVPKQSPEARADRQATMHLLGSVKGALFGGKAGQLDKRQKKTAILVGLLVAVLAIVLVIVLNPGVSKVNADSKKGPQDEAAVIKKDLVYQWKQPQVYPASLRDPMKRASQAHASSGESQGELMVRGIVYSDTNSTAIIAGQIVKQGETVAGAKIIKINRDSVEFEKDGKRWVQQVEQ